MYLCKPTMQRSNPLNKIWAGLKFIPKNGKHGLAFSFTSHGGRMFRFKPSFRPTNDHSNKPLFSFNA